MLPSTFLLQHQAQLAAHQNPNIEVRPLAMHPSLDPKLLDPKTMITPCSQTLPKAVAATATVTPAEVETQQGYLTQPIPMPSSKDGADQIG